VVGVDLLALAGLELDVPVGRRSAEVEPPAADRDLRSARILTGWSVLRVRVSRRRARRRAEWRRAEQAQELDVAFGRD
jgi:hypothetical protein